MLSQASEISGFCHLMGCMRPPGPMPRAAAGGKAQKHRSDPSTAEQEVPVPTETQDTTHNYEVQHVCPLKRLLGAFSRPMPSNTFPLQPPTD